MADTKAQAILAYARKIAPECKSWGDFTNMLFDGKRGFVSKTLKSTAERRAFGYTIECGAIIEITARLMKQHGLIAPLITTKDWTEDGK